MVGWDPLGRCNEATLFKIFELMNSIQECRTGERSEAWGRTLGELDSAVELARIMAEVKSE